MNLKTIRFTALDTLFFRESRPFDAIGGAELASVFPPPPRTVMGAIRSAIGEASGVDWREFQRNDVHPLRAVIGFGDALGPLSIGGVWLSKQGDRLYPAPLHLFCKQDPTNLQFARLAVSAPVQTHLGNVALPQIPKQCAGYKPMEGAWLSRAGLEAVLNGNVPRESQVFFKADLFAAEPRLGIARSNARGTVESGMLYQTQHLRPKLDVAIEVDLIAPEDLKLADVLLHLGGEGRLAGMQCVDESHFPAKPNANAVGMILTLITAARFNRQPHDLLWLPAEFTAKRSNGPQVWKGKLHGINLTVHCAVIGKALREGGWDLASHTPRSVQSLIPAGSSYYCTVDGPLEVAIAALHGKAIGEESNLGRGRVVCGLWNANESITTQGKSS